MLRILHTADWHLGKMLGDLSRETEHRAFLDFLLEIIATEKIDALLIAGDVFDSANPPQSAVAQYYQFLSSVHQTSQCQVIVTAGNHDSPAHIEAPKELLKLLRTHVIGAMPSDRAQAMIPLPNEHEPLVYIAAVPFLRDRDLRTGISGQSSAEIQASLNDAITTIYQEMVDLRAQSSAPLIAMGHLTVSGSKTSDSEREIHVGGLGALPADRFPAAYAYVALGHLHRPQACDTNDLIRYSGSPIPLSFSESRDHKELRLLEVNDGTLQHRSIAIPQARELRQVVTNSADAEFTLTQLAQEFAHQTAKLKPWIELFINDPLPGDQIAQRCAEAAKNAPYEIVRIIQPTSQDPAATTWDSNQGDQKKIDDLLGDPASLFQWRIDQETTIPEEQKITLRQTFASLLALHRNE